MNNVLKTRNDRSPGRNMEALKLAVLLGGPSDERAISLKSGEAVAAALETLGHTVERIDPRTPDWTLPPDVSVVFLALHGRYGEDGTVQRQLDDWGVPYTGCDAEASSIAFDKIRTKDAWARNGIPTPRGVALSEPLAAPPDGWGLPLILKPVDQGSSVGLQIVEAEDTFESALNQALQFGELILMEELIRGREFTVGILDGEALPLVEVRPRSGAFDYENKYTDGKTDYFCPADLEPEQTRRIQELALRAFETVGGRDYGRLDVMLDSRGNPHFLELNTLPGMTETSLLPKAAAAQGLDYPALCQRMVELALRRANPNQKESHVVA